MIKAVIFDMDGVIFDTERVYLEIWKSVFEKYGYKKENDKVNVESQKRT